MNLEEITRRIEDLKQYQKNCLDKYDEQITVIQERKRKFYEEMQKEIDAGLYFQKTLLGDNEKVETESFVIQKKHPNMKSKATYKLEIPSDKKEKEKFIDYLRQEHQGLVKEEVSYKPIQNDIKQLIVDGIFNITEEGLLVDDNGLAIPYVQVNVKDMELKVKVKK